MRSIFIVAVMLLLHAQLALSLVQYCPPLCFKHHYLPVNALPLPRISTGPSMTLWTQFSEFSAAATNMCVSACFVVPVLHSGFGLTLRVVQRLEKALGNYAFFVGPLFLAGYRIASRAMHKKDGDESIEK
jgi:hypothetical protein